MLWLRIPLKVDLHACMKALRLRPTAWNLKNESAWSVDRANLMRARLGLVHDPDNRCSRSAWLTRDEDHIEGYRCVSHPKGLHSNLIEDKEHPAPLLQTLSPHQAPATRLWGRCNLHCDAQGP